jgi:ATP-binding cassette subfamily F protein 3
VQSSANLLILDEPTNHLDVESREALEDALRSFPGTVLLVSHDRALLDAVGTRTVAIEDGTLRSYAGGWAEYVRVREERKALRLAKGSKNGKAIKAEGRKASAPAKAAPAKPVGPSKNRKKLIASLERQIEAAESALAALEDELADPSAWASPTASARSSKRHAAAKGEVERLYAELETAGA